jgi:hypothetical protein
MTNEDDAGFILLFVEEIKNLLNFSFLSYSSNA